MLRLLFQLSLLCHCTANSHAFTIFSCRVLGSNREPIFFCNCGDTESQSCTFEDPLPGNCLKVPFQFLFVPCLFVFTFMLPVSYFLKTCFLLQDWKLLLVWRGSCLAFKWRKWCPRMLSSLIPSAHILYWTQRKVGWLITDHWTGRIIHLAWISLSRIIRWGPWNLHVQLKDACRGALQGYSLN